MKNKEFATAAGATATGTAAAERRSKKKMTWATLLLCVAVAMLHSSFFISCTESEDDETDEYANWQQRNEAYFNTLEDSLRSHPDQWRKLRLYYKPESSTAADNTEFVYVKVLESGASDVQPMYTDSVRLSYRGRLIPTASYAQGFVFDQTYVGDYSRQTTGVAEGLTSGFVTGFTNALLYMHVDDRWRIYIPHQLGYGANAQTGIPAYSTLIFDVDLIDVTQTSKPFPVWSKAWHGNN